MLRLKFIYIIFIILIVGCSTLKVNFKDVNEKNIRKVQVTTKLQSPLGSETDLTSLCREDEEIVYAKFFSNRALEVWCGKSDTNSMKENEI